MIEAELHYLGLGATEERAYEALLAERVDEAEELARHLRLPRDEVDAALDRLVEHGLALPPRGGGTLPRPAAPAAAIRSLIHRRQAELHMKSAELERLRMTADQLAGRLTAGAPAVPGSGIEVITGQRAIGERADDLLASAEREVVILDRPPYVKGRPGYGTFRAPGACIEGLLDRGVTVRTVLDRDGLAAPERIRTLHALVERGLRARVAPAVPTRLIAVDRRTALLPPGDAADPTASALVVGDALLRHALVPLFETVWDRAAPVGGPCTEPPPAGATRPAPSGALPAEQKELLTLLAAGLKDEAIARRLGVHVHTARRRISRLLESLGAETRFQAGARATLRGWLDTS
ncbi:helix-turn-helix domain-containing protein [Streptomyces sp. NPDC019507]|uniref:helix-turn-helix domain-containing protein n=1 Tax=Streptomyces sp. NPDC019507 TaxID=3154689 RepID=UPI003407D5E3